jgi:hypothetical protein
MSKSTEPEPVFKSCWWIITKTSSAVKTVSKYLDLFTIIASIFKSKSFLIPLCREIKLRLKLNIDDIQKSS